MPDLPSNARVVIVGGGIVGCSVAYHLALRGVTEIGEHVSGTVVLTLPAR